MRDALDTQLAEFAEDADVTPGVLLPEPEHEVAEAGNVALPPAYVARSHRAYVW